MDNLAYSIDWLRWSVPLDVPTDKALPPVRELERSDHELKPLPWYTAAQALEHGRVDWNDEKPQLRKLVTLSGHDLAALVTGGQEPLELVRFVLAVPGVHVNRLDFAADLRDSGGNLRDLVTRFHAGELQTRAQEISTVESTRPDQGTALTVYLGSRAARRFLRAYDKAKQARVAGDWIRLELELKKHAAYQVAAAMLRHGVIPAGKAALREFVVTGLAWFDGATDPDLPGVYITHERRWSGDWEHWVYETVLPALEKALRLQVPGVRDKTTVILARTAHHSTDHGDGGLSF
jgi:hypothetical protein